MISEATGLPRFGSTGTYGHDPRAPRLDRLLADRGAAVDDQSESGVRPSAVGSSEETEVETRLNDVRKDAKDASASDSDEDDSSADHEDPVLAARLQAFQLRQDPARAIAEMATLRRDALSPREPSSESYRVAAAASRAIAEARRALEEDDERDDESTEPTVEPSRDDAAAPHEARGARSKEYLRTNPDPTSDGPDRPHVNLVS